MKRQYRWISCNMKRIYQHISRLTRLGERINSRSHVDTVQCNAPSFIFVLHCCAASYLIACDLRNIKNWFDTNIKIKATRLHGLVIFINTETDPQTQKYLIQEHLDAPFSLSFKEHLNCLTSKMMYIFTSCRENIILIEIYRLLAGTVMPPVS